MFKKLYSAEYAELLKEKHNKEKWGGAVKGKVSEIVFMLKLLDENEILDYGCGYGYFKKEVEEKHKGFNLKINEYDPGIEGKNSDPNPCNFVICIDVMEHIEPDYVDNVLDDLESLTNNVCYFGISTIDVYHLLADGRNAHLSVHPMEWWRKKINERFNIIRESYNESYCKFIVKKR